MVTANFPGAQEGKNDSLLIEKHRYEEHSYCAKCDHVVFEAATLHMRDTVRSSPELVLLS